MTDLNRILSSHAPLTLSGASTGFLPLLLSDLARDLAGAGYRVEVLTSRQRYEDPTARLIARESVGGVEVRLYSLAGLKSAYRALRAGGSLTVWSAAQSPAFSERMRAVGFAVEEVQTRGRGGRGPHHWIWVGLRGARAKKSTL